MPKSWLHSTQLSVRLAEIDAAFRTFIKGGISRVRKKERNLPAGFETSLRGIQIPVVNGARWW